ncbi:MAG TPA: SIMPL domain-containing protein [Candidatus Cybelea sp.]|nr:SIMPL domain-containing protein [Candidatus Cybelea sp.]
MKRTFLCLLAAFWITGGLAAAAQPGVTEITASGTGTVALPPDIATVRAGLQTNASSASDAVSQNNAAYDRIVGGVAKLGIARADVALDYYNVRYNPRPQTMAANPTGEQFGYTVSRNFQVTVRRIGMAGTVVDACIDAGATDINGVTFGLADRVAARAQAISKAIADARANAETIARSAGLRIVSIKSIAYPDNGYAEPTGMATIARVTSRVSTDLDQSNVSESASVRVVFLAEP